jgi:hypothetical protein
MNKTAALVFILATCLTSAFPCFPAFAQAQTSLPSKEEISELLSKADQKISSFEIAVKNAKPYIDEINPQLATNYLDAASTAHTMILALGKNGPSAYRLVGLLTTLDDLSLDAANASVRLLRMDEEYVIKGGKPNAKAFEAVVGLTAAGTGCNDIAELIMHATMRYIRAEEDTLDKLLRNHH